MARFWNKHLTTAELRREVAKRGVLCKYAGCRNALSHRRAFYYKFLNLVLFLINKYRLQKRIYKNY